MRTLPLRLRTLWTWCVQRWRQPVPMTPLPQTWAPLPEPSAAEVAIHREVQQVCGGPLTDFESLVMMLTQARLVYVASHQGTQRQVIEITTVSKQVIIAEFSAQGMLVRLEIKGAGT